MTDTPPSETVAPLQDVLDSGALTIINGSEGEDVYHLLAALDILLAEKTGVGQIDQIQAVQLLM